MSLLGTMIKEWGISSLFPSCSHDWWSPSVALLSHGPGIILILAVPGSKANMKLPNGRNEKPHLSSTFLKNAQYDSAYTVYVLSCFICPWLLVCSWDWYIEQIYNFFYVLCINHDSGNLKMICAMYQLWFWKFENECCCLGVIALEQTRRKICSDRSTGHSRRTQWAQVNVQIAMWFQEKKKQVIRVSVTIRNIIITQDALTWLARADDGTWVLF
jgi:hypothetical protein